MKTFKVSVETLNKARMHQNEQFGEEVNKTVYNFVNFGLDIRNFKNLEDKQEYIIDCYWANDEVINYLEEFGELTEVAYTEWFNLPKYDIINAMATDFTSDSEEKLSLNSINAHFRHIQSIEGLKAFDRAELDEVKYWVGDYEDRFRYAYKYKVENHKDYLDEYYYFIILESERELDEEVVDFLEHHHYIVDDYDLMKKTITIEFSDFYDKSDREEIVRLLNLNYPQFKMVGFDDEDTIIIEI